MKRKFNYNIIVFVVVAALIVGGWFSSDMIKGLKNSVKAFVKEPSLSTFVDNVDSASKKYSYRYAAVDIHSLSYRITGTKVVKKNSDTVVRMNNDYLSYDYATVSDEVIRDTADSCAALSDFCKSAGIPFMYIYAPQKQYFGEFPEYVENTARKEGDQFVSELRKRNVNVLSLAEKMIEQDMKMEDSYFITDHHWTPETGFWAAGEICKKLNSDYGFEWDSKITDISNYNTKVYEDWFLGSQGKKTGRFFTPLGVDDITLITPKFETDLSVKDKGKVRTGKFENTIIGLNKIETKGLHTYNPYAAYSLGDFAEQTIENNLATNNTKILVIRDSYACAVTPFIALTSKSMRVLDLRKDLHGEACIDSVSEYINEYQPDYVMVLYSGLASAESGTKMAQHFEFN